MFSHLGKGQGGGETTFEIIREGLAKRGHCIVPAYNDKQRDQLWGLWREPGGGYRSLIALPNWWRHLVRPRGLIQCTASFVNAFRLLQCEQPDVVYIHYFSISALLFAIRKPFFGYRFVIGCQGTDVEDMHGLRRRLAPYILGRADAITCVSNAQVDAMRNQVEVDTPTQVIYNGVEADFWQADPGRVSSGMHVISVGATRIEKGHDVLIRAFQRVAAEFPEAHLTIVGDGSYRNACEQLIDDLGLRSSVTITGWIDRPEIQELLETAQVFAFPSRQEAFGMALLEAMSSGLPVVATHVGGIPEVLKGTGAQLVPPDDDVELAESLISALENTEWRENTAQAGVKRAQELSRTTMINQYEETLTGRL